MSMVRKLSSEARAAKAAARDSLVTGTSGAGGAPVGATVVGAAVGAGVGAAVGAGVGAGVGVDAARGQSFQPVLVTDSSEIHCICVVGTKP